jgi:hypothetical protein
LFRNLFRKNRPSLGAGSPRPDWGRRELEPTHRTGGLRSCSIEKACPLALELIVRLTETRVELAVRRHVDVQLCGGIAGSLADALCDGKQVRQLGGDGQHGIKTAEHVAVTQRQRLDDVVLAVLDRPLVDPREAFESASEALSQFPEIRDQRYRDELPCPRITTLEVAINNEVQASRSSASTRREVVN